MASQVMMQPGAPAEIAHLPGNWPPQGQWRYEDYLRLPDDGRRYEIIEGILYVSSAPDYDHQFTVSKLTRYFDVFLTDNGMGIVLNAPFEVHLAEHSRPVQPDVLCILAPQMLAPGAKFFAGAPDLVVEVISPSSIRRDRNTKFDAYEKAGVAEYWLADPKTRSVEVYTLSNGEFALFGQYTGDEAIQSAVLPGLTIKTSQLFNA
jgi:Uma2 family endonuclease